MVTGKSLSLMQQMNKNTFYYCPLLIRQGKVWSLPVEMGNLKELHFCFGCAPNTVTGKILQLPHCMVFNSMRNQHLNIWDINRVKLAAMEKKQLSLQTWAGAQWIFFPIQPLGETLYRLWFILFQFSSCRRNNISQAWSEKYLNEPCARLYLAEYILDCRLLIEPAGS